MNPEFSIDPLQLVLRGCIQAVHMLGTTIWSLPFWSKVLLGTIIFVHLAWPKQLREEHPRRYRRRSTGGL